VNFQVNYRWTLSGPYYKFRTGKSENKMVSNANRMAIFFMWRQSKSNFDRRITYIPDYLAEFGLHFHVKSSSKFLLISCHRICQITSFIIGRCSLPSLPRINAPKRSEKKMKKDYTSKIGFKHFYKQKFLRMVRKWGLTGHLNFENVAFTTIHQPANNEIKDEHMNVN